LKKEINIIGISCYYHDSAAALIKNGIVLSAIQEERLSRIKHDSSFPKNSIKKF
jgi:carbamoyltransferase